MTSHTKDTATLLWTSIPWTARQALRIRNRSPFQYPDGSEGIFFLLGPDSPPIGCALYRTRKGECRAELYAVCGARNGLNSKLLTETVTRVELIEDLLLRWGEEFSLT